MQPQKVIIGHSWIDETLNIQTKNVAFKLSEAAKVFYFTQSRIRHKLPDNPNLKVIEWPNKRPTKIKDFIFAIRQVYKLKPDLIIVHFASTKALIFAGWLFGVKHRVAWYHTLYGQTRLEAPNKLRAWFDVWVRTVTYKMSTNVIAQTKFAASDVVHNQDVRPDKVFIIPNGMQAPVVRQTDYDYKGDFIVFLYVGRLTYTKGCDLLIKAFGKLHKLHKDSILHLIGKGDDENSLQTLITNENLQSGVAIKGATTSYRQVYENMTKAYALIVPSRIDNYPTVIIEAMACGLPVIGAGVGGIPEMIENGIDGFIYSSENDLIEKCKLLIQNRVLRNIIATNARSSFERKYAVEKHVENVMKFINSLP